MGRSLTIGGCDVSGDRTERPNAEEIAARALCAYSRNGVDHCTCNGNCGDAWKRFIPDARIVINALEAACLKVIWVRRVDRIPFEITDD